MPKVRGFEKVSLETLEKFTKDFGLNDIVLPHRKTAKSAGYDIISPIAFNIGPKEEIKFPLGFKVYMLNDEYLMIVPRSSLGFKYYVRLANTLGVIDSDFYNNAENEGLCFVKIRNEGSSVLQIKKGDAIAQAIFNKYLLVDNDDFLGNERIGGIGSTNT